MRDSGGELATHDGGTRPAWRDALETHFQFVEQARSGPQRRPPISPRPGKGYPSGKPSPGFHLGPRDTGSSRLPVPAATVPSGFLRTERCRRAAIALHVVASTRRTRAGAGSCFTILSPPRLGGLERQEPIGELQAPSIGRACGLAGRALARVVTHICKFVAPKRVTMRCRIAASLSDPVVLDGDLLALQPVDQQRRLLGLDDVEASPRSPRGNCPGTRACPALLVPLACAMGCSAAPDPRETLAHLRIEPQDLPRRQTEGSSRRDSPASEGRPDPAVRHPCADARRGAPCLRQGPRSVRAVRLARSAMCRSCCSPRRCDRAP